MESLDSALEKAIFHNLWVHVVIEGFDMEEYVVDGLHVLDDKFS